VFVALYHPEVVIVALYKLSPFDQVFTLVESVVSITDPPSQNVVALNAEILASGAGFTVKSKLLDVAVHPSAFVTITE
jgi:hypothetical protein